MIGKPRIDVQFGSEDIRDIRGQDIRGQYTYCSTSPLLKARPKAVGGRRGEGGRVKRKYVYWSEPLY